MGVINRNSSVARRRSLSRLGFLNAAASEQDLEARAEQRAAAVATATPTPTSVATVTPTPTPTPVVTVTPTPAPVATVTLAPVATVEPNPPPPVAAVYTAPTPTPTPAAVIAPTPAKDALDAFTAENPPAYMRVGDDYATVNLADPTHPAHEQFLALEAAAEAEQRQAEYDSQPQFLKDFQSALTKYGEHAVGEAWTSGALVVPAQYQQAASDMLAKQQANESLSAWDSWGYSAWLMATAAITGGVAAPGLVAATGSTVIGGAATGAIVGTQTAALTGGDIVKGAITGAVTGSIVGEAKDLITAPSWVQAESFPVSEPIVIESAPLEPLPEPVAIEPPPIEIESPPLMTSEQVIAAQESTFTTAPEIEQGATMPPAIPERDAAGVWENVFGNTWHQIEPPIEQVVITAPPIEAVAEPEPLFVPPVAVPESLPTSEQIIASQESAVVASDVQQVVITDSPMMPPAVAESPEALAEQGLVETSPGVFEQAANVAPWVQLEQDVIPQVVITDSPTMPPAVPESPEALAEQGLVETSPGVFEQASNVPPWVADEQVITATMPPAVPESSESLQEQGLTETSPGVFEQAPPEDFTTTTTETTETTNETNPPPGGGGGPSPFDDLIKVGTKLLPGLLFRNKDKNIPIATRRRPLAPPEYLNRPKTQAGMSGNFWLFAGLGLMAVVLDAPKKRRRR